METTTVAVCGACKLRPADANERIPANLPGGPIPATFYFDGKDRRVCSRCQDLILRNWTLTQIRRKVRG